MQIVGELINGSRKQIAEYIENKSDKDIQKIALAQKNAGADFIDVNAGMFHEKESSYISWLVKTVQEDGDIICAIDSPDPKAIEAGLSVHQGDAMINSISFEKKRLNNLLPLIAGTNHKVIALCIHDEGMPRTCEDRLKIADKLINKLVQNNILLENIYVDPLVHPISTDTEYGVAFLDAVEKIMISFKGIHTICGLSNISYGLPQRKQINRVFGVTAMARGLDAAIINPLDRILMADLITARTLAGKDEFCVNYLNSYRQGKFKEQECK